MQAVFHVDSDELDLNFLNMIKQHFTNSKLDIIVREQDETDYLNSSPRNRRLLEEAISDMELGSNTISKTLDELAL